MRFATNLARTPLTRDGLGGFATRDSPDTIGAKISHIEKAPKNFTVPLAVAASHSYLRSQTPWCRAQILGRFLPRLSDHLRVVFFYLYFTAS